MKKTESSDNPVIMRRTVVKGAAWSVPVLAAAVAAPLAAASTPPCIPTEDAPLYNAELTVTAQTDPYPNVNPTGTPHYDVPLNTHVNATNTYTNTGSEPWPVGTQIWVEVSNNMRDLHASIVGVSGAFASSLGTPVYTAAPGSSTGGFGTRYVYTTIAEVPVGGSVTVDWEFWATTTHGWNGFYTLARVIIPATLSCDGTTTMLSRTSSTGSVPAPGSPAWYYVVRA